MSFQTYPSELTAYTRSYPDGYEGKTAPATIPRGAPWKMEARPLGLLKVTLDGFSPWRPPEWVNSLYQDHPDNYEGKTSPRGYPVGHSEGVNRWLANLTLNNAELIN